jgi:hypothetical protein
MNTTNWNKRMIQQNTEITFYKDIRFWLILIALATLLYLLFEGNSIK